MMMTLRRMTNAQSFYRWVAGGLGAAFLTVVVAAASHHFTLQGSLTKSDVREIVRATMQETPAVTKEDVRAIVKAEQLSREDLREVISAAYTGLSNSRGMYALEGRPKIDALEDRVRSLESQLRAATEDGYRGRDAERDHDKQQQQLDRVVADLNQQIKAITAELATVWQVLREIETRP